MIKKYLQFINEAEEVSVESPVKKSEDDSKYSDLKDEV